jgi:hypothetical protein
MISEPGKIRNRQQGEPGMNSIPEFGIFQIWHLGESGISGGYVNDSWPRQLRIMEESWMAETRLREKHTPSGITRIPEKRGFRQ